MLISLIEDFQMLLQLLLIIIYNCIMYVCICNAVTETEIVSSVQKGNDNLDSVSVKLGVGMYCGSCVQVAKALIEVAKGDEHKSSRTQLAHSLTD